MVNANNQMFARDYRANNLMGVIGCVIGLMIPENMHFIMGGCDGINIFA